MSKYKAVVDFSSYTGPAFLPFAQNIHSQMTTNAAIFTTPPVTMPNFAALISE